MTNDWSTIHVSAPAMKFYTIIFTFIEFNVLIKQEWLLAAAAWLLLCVPATVLCADYPAARS